ncbi:hypothetical protein [Methylobacterium oryzisoli]|uniref:hypothetical protein n=1 Tax=Methylobacterium oryzisoli TaxID=3385502 RepID=UPI003891C9E3
MSRTGYLQRVGAGMVLAAMVAGAALAQDEPTAAENRAGPDLDSEHLFGFTEGTDLGVPGELELEQETTGRIGKRGGTFRAFDPTLALKIPLSENFRVAPGLSFAAYDVARGAGLPSSVRGGFNGAFLETRARLLDRRTAPVGLTLSLVPSIGMRDSGTGLSARSHGLEASLLLDRELIPGRLVGALNVSYAFARTRPDGADAGELGSGLEVSGALAYRVLPSLFLGGEVRYLRAYDGLGLDRFAGEAVYLGPTLYASVSDHAWVSFTWGTQVAGRAVGEPGPLDLTGFDRHQARLRIGYSF